LAPAQVTGTDADEGDLLAAGSRRDSEQAGIAQQRVGMAARRPVQRLEDGAAADDDRVAVAQFAGDGDGGC
jgi:hypothetical protein